MTYPLIPVEWESRFFGFPIGNIELPADYSSKSLDESLRRGQKIYRLIYVTLNKIGPAELPTSGAPCLCYDRNLTFKKSVPDNVPSLDTHVKAYTSSFCSKWLERLAVQSGVLTRFKQDPELATQYERLFLTWINYSVTGELADSIWTWREADKHVGLVTIRCVKHQNPDTGALEREGRIGMLAVDRDYRKQGIGTHLFDACDFWCSSLDIPVISIVTQEENEQTTALCEKLGYHLTDEESVYHYWSPGWVYDTRRGWIHRAKV